MAGIVESLDSFLRGLSGASAGLGLFVIACFDSSLLSLPEVNDLLLVYFGARFPSRAFYYASMTMMGSALGASLLYSLARWQGYSFLEKRFSRGRLRPALELVRRYGALAVLLPSILPPPFPFKIFVLSSGAMGLPVPRFLGAIIVGRSVRYYGQAWLAVRYGDEAIEFLRGHTREAFLAVLLIVLAVAVFHLVRERRGRLSGAEGELADLEEP